MNTPQSVLSHPPILGVDTNSFGFHVVSSKPILMPGADGQMDDGERTLGWIVTNAKDSYDRLRIVHHQAIAFFRTLPDGSSLWVEEALILPKNPETTRKLVMMAGVLYSAFLEACPNATWFWVDVSTWRRQIINPAKGQSPRKSAEWKEAARLWVSEHGYPSWREYAELSEVYAQQDDLYDAHCLMAYGAKMLGSGVVKLK